MVTVGAVRGAVELLGLARQPVCVHASFRSFGPVEGGPDAVIDGILAAGCTILAPAFSWTFAVPPPPDPSLRPERNGWNYDSFPGPTEGVGRRFSPGSGEIDADMGVIAAHLLRREGCIRGNHPICSFAAVGPLAEELIQGQHPLDVYAPLEALVAHGGAVVRMGVKTNTLLHLAEKMAGRNLFWRWYNGPEGEPLPAEVGGCSGGFGAFEPILAPVRKECLVGESRWTAYPAREALELSILAIHANPAMTHCRRDGCNRCNDAVQGGPILPEAKG